MKDRKTIVETLDSSICCGDGDTIEISQLLKRIKDFDIEQDRLYLYLNREEGYIEYGQSIGDSINLELRYDRKETDEEYNIRLAKEKEYLDKRKQAELEQYLKLKSKFESNGDK